MSDIYNFRIWIQLAHPGWLIINASYAVIYIWCDITVEDNSRRELYREIRKKNEELKIVAKKAELAAQTKSEFLSRMSHDIRTPMIPIIAMTANAFKEDAQKCFSAGMNAHLSKPLEMDKVVSTILKQLL